jgi:hypothetical protein
LEICNEQRRRCRRDEANPESIDEPRELIADVAECVVRWITAALKFLIVRRQIPERLAPPGAALGPVRELINRENYR